MVKRIGSERKCGMGIGTKIKAEIREKDDLYAFSESEVVIIGEEFVENSVCVEVVGLQH